MKQAALHSKCFETLLAVEEPALGAFYRPPHLTELPGETPRGRPPGWDEAK